MLAKPTPCYQLVIDLLETTPSGQALKNCQTEADLHAAINICRATFADNNEALENIVDMEARKKTQKL